MKAATRAAVLVLGISVCTSILPAQGQIGGCSAFPPNNVWNTPVNQLPVDAQSAAYIQTIGAGTSVHPDFGSGLWDGGPIGIPFVVVPAGQKKVAVTFTDYGDESDPGPYPIPADAPIEGGAASSGDRHVLVVDAGSCKLYELYNAAPNASGGWNASCGAVFDLSSNQFRPLGWTSADAAGFAILPGLVRYDEVASGEIPHAVRFTVPQTRNMYVWPATHSASNRSGLQYPPMGQRFRLRATFNETGLSTEAQVIAQALKKYGMIIADNGSSWYISGAPDERWNNDHLRDLASIKGSDFEAVDESGLMISQESGEARAQAPSVAFHVLNAASLMEKPVSPGEIITIMGTGLGSSVTVDGTPARILYSSPKQINAILPATLAGTSTTIAVAGAGSVTVPVVSATPAIFTLSANGQGQGAVLNQDSTINGLDGPAGKGTIIQIFGTGGGAMTDPVTVQIGGQSANVVYSGFAPQAVPGLIQINAVVPQQTASGNVLIAIGVGTAESPSGVTISVR